MRKIRTRFFLLHIGRNCMGEPCFLLWLKPKPDVRLPDAITSSEIWEVGPDGTVSVTPKTTS